MAKKVRKIVKEEEYEVCDLCGGEVSPNSGNTIIVGEKTYTVHFRGEMAELENTCVGKLVIETIEKKNKK